MYYCYSLLIQQWICFLIVVNTYSNLHYISGYQVQCELWCYQTHLNALLEYLCDCGQDYTCILNTFLILSSCCLTTCVRTLIVTVVSSCSVHEYSPDGMILSKLLVTRHGALTRICAFTISAKTVHNKNHTDFPGVHELQSLY